MVKWTKEHPFGALLVNLGITILIVFSGVLYVKSHIKERYGNKIDIIYEDTKIIVDVMKKLPKQDG